MDELLLNGKERIKDLIIKALSGNAKVDEIKEVQDWIAQSKDNEAVFLELKYTWQLTSDYNTDSFNAEIAWNRVRPAIMKDSPTRINYNRNRNWLIKIAAIVLLLLVTGVTAYYLGSVHAFRKTQSERNSMNEIVAPLGSKSNVTLPDGTKVWLNAGSSLRYSQDFNTRERDVYLIGEAFFKVHTNRAKPFVVHTPEINIKAFGTSFNVKAYPEERTITTTLVEGEVKIESTWKETQKFEHSMKPNEKLTYIKEVVPVQNNIINTNEKNSIDTISEPVPLAKEPVIVNSDIKTSLYTSWKDDKWIIERENFKELCIMLERRFAVKFIYKSEILEKYKISGTIRKETLEQVLDLLKLTTPLKYEIKEGIVILDYDINRSENYIKAMN